jgi:UDP-3-O-[3-hydroxymyristoyl] glucosamine N-acyltransferase
LSATSATIHPTAVLGSDVEVGEGATIGPFSVLGDAVRVGAGVRIDSHVVIGRDCRIGARSVLHSHAVLYADVWIGDDSVIESGTCLGSDGFGFAHDGQVLRKIPQVGGCRIGAEFRIGANSTVDRGSVGNTRIGDSCGIASLAHIGHNAVLGDSVRLGALGGIAGSALIGDDVDLGSQTATMGHLRVGSGVRLRANGGITHDVENGSTISGIPGRPERETRRADRLLARLPRIAKRILALEREVVGDAAREDARAGATLSDP